MVSPQGRKTWTVDDRVPYVEKLTILSKEQERITEPVVHGPALERRFPPQQFHMLQSSVETRGFDRRRKIVQAEDFSQQMEQHGHGMYYMPPIFLSILRRCISILLKVLTLICLQANIRMMVLRKHILIFHGRP